MNLAELTSERRRELAAHLASDIFAPDGPTQVELEANRSRRFG